MTDGTRRSDVVDVASWLVASRQAVDETLERLLPAESGPAARVAGAMRYAVTGGGKRLRPILALAACEAAGGTRAGMLEPAAALELIHTYSLIHDDLPAMDDDDLRRGRPTVHRAYGEADAILAGDALQALALEILATWPAGDSLAGRRADAVLLVARAAGISGMVGGQSADLAAERDEVDAARLEWIHRHKTGALLSASAELGAIHAAASPDARAALAAYGQGLGLAFQIADDILDCTSSADALGKTPGKDQVAGKATYPALFGIDDSRRRAERIVEAALDTLRAHDLLRPPLAELARFAVRRDR
jgi:geranylgeranyl pyrophosphate synthase